jgi:hypothetical protein
MFPPRRMIHKDRAQAYEAPAYVPMSVYNTQFDQYISEDEHNCLMSKCPNESWECTKIQHRLEAKLDTARKALEEIRGRFHDPRAKKLTGGRPWHIANEALKAIE